MATNDNDFSRRDLPRAGAGLALQSSGTAAAQSRAQHDSGPTFEAPQPSGGQKPDKLVSCGHDSPMGRPGQPAEIAPLYVLLADPMASFVSGDIYGSTGGKPQG